MRRSILPAAGLLLLIACGSASGDEPDFRADLEAILGFEAGRADSEQLTGWDGGPAGTLGRDREVVHSGAGAALLVRDADSPGTFSTITKRLPLDFKGEWIELRGFLRTEGVEGFTGLWMRVDGEAGVLAFDNMGKRGIAGSTDWTGYSILLPLSPYGREVYFGALLSGEGRVWADDLELLVDDRPIAEVPRRVVVQTVLDTDKEFDDGSGIGVSMLTEQQADHLALLGRIWGFLKYHHPRVAGGELHWDYELFRVLPPVLEAGDGAAARRVLADWIDDLGVPGDCDPCAGDPQDPHLLPRLDWMQTLSPRLSVQLQAIHERRFAGTEQFYVGQTPYVGNPLFHRDLAYPDQDPPDGGFRLLALMRWWNIIEYWFPYRDQIEDDWYDTLREFLPRIAAAEDRDGYRLELMQLIARAADGHANLWTALDVRPPRGECFWPVHLRFVGGRAVVVTLQSGAETQLQPGDVVESIDGAPVASLVDEWSPYYGTSNEAARLRDMARYLSRGDCGDSEAEVRRGGELQSLTVPRTRQPGRNQYVQWHDRPGETFQKLAPDIAYLKLSSIRAVDVASHVKEAAGTRGLVLDLRNYPSDSVMYALCARLVREPTEFARFTRGELHNPGAFSWTDAVTLEPQAPGYHGQVAVLVDEVTQSSAEYTAMACRAGPGAVVVGSTTAGADGNVSRFALPGELATMISGIGVFYPDRTPTQRVGIVPDIVARPTIEGIREGRDEVLEAALRHLLGPDADEETVRRMARRP